MAANLLSDLTAPSFDDPLGMLSACHGRIDRQLATLERLQRHLPEHGCDTDARVAARAILKYFDTAAPNHHEDEEASVFPRLIVALPDAAARLVADLAKDHAQLATNWRRLRPMLAAIAAGQRANLSPAQVAAVRAAYDAHIDKEETELIPLAAEVFDAATLKAIGEEMAARRGVDPRAPARRAL
ncbi:MAG: hemerythrin domain-containing protein [Betaproteobacteria bacterium]